MSLLKCDQIWKIYRNGRSSEIVALRDITVEIHKGEFVTITGPSGSGKTTLLSILATLDKPTKGTVFFDGNNILELSERALTLLRRNKIGFVFQDFNLLRAVKAWKNVAYPLLPEGINEKQAKAKAMRILQRIGLDHRAEATAEQLSGGELQRLAIARALVKNPEILFLDEPTSNIDKKTKTLVIALLEELKRQGKTIVVVTHDETLIQLSDKVLYLEDGRLSA